MGALQVEETVEASAATPAGNFIIKHESNAVKGSLAQKKKKKEAVMGWEGPKPQKNMLISGLLGLTHDSVYKSLFPKVLWVGSSSS